MGGAMSRVVTMSMVSLSWAFTSPKSPNLVNNQFPFPLPLLALEGAGLNRARAKLSSSFCSRVVVVSASLAGVTSQGAGGCSVATGSGQAAEVSPCPDLRLRRHRILVVVLKRRRCLEPSEGLGPPGRSHPRRQSLFSHLAEPAHPALPPGTVISVQWPSSTGLRVHEVSHTRSLQTRHC